MKQKKIKIEELKQHVGKEVTLQGFVQKIREQSKIKFLILRDITRTVQCITFKEEQVFQKIETEHLTHESVIEIKGIVKEEKQAPQGIEIQLKHLTILSKAEELPIQVVEKNKEEASQSKRLDYRWIDLRKQKKLEIFQTLTKLERGTRKYFEKEKYIQVYTPSFMDTPSESGAEVFEVDYFGKKAYLAQSPQFYKQMALASGFEKVFVTGPVYRAEKSSTTRHLTQFHGIDFEVAYITQIQQLIEIEEDMLIEAFKEIGITPPQKPFPQITMKEAKQLLKQHQIPSEREDDLSPLEERELSKLIKETRHHDFVFLTDFPITSRPFYHQRKEGEPQITKSFDLLYKGIEITTGAIREHRLEILKKQAKSKQMSEKALEKYFQFFKFGCPPHGGCGLGPERIVMKILDLESIKEASFLPRDCERLSP